LQALITEMSPTGGGDEIELIEISRISTNPYQPRREFSEEGLKELADSLRVHGLIQPITVRRRGRGYELVVGERRWRAAQLAGFEEIAAVVRDMSDEETMEVAIIENLQREDLNPIEEALAYRQLMDTLSYTQERLAERVGKSRPYVANALRLLTLPDDMVRHVSRGTISPGHARAILATPEAQRRALLDKIIREQCTVRQAELFAQRAQGDVSRETGGKKPRKPALSPELAEVERRLRERLQARVNLRPRGERGSIEIEYYSQEELERLLELFTIQ
jgi:ParB family chromosome partitioning protein